MMAGMNGGSRRGSFLLAGLASGALAVATAVTAAPQAAALGSQGVAPGGGNAPSGVTKGDEARIAERMWRISEIEAQLKTAEEYRLRGDCAARDAELDWVVSSMNYFGPQAFPPDQRAEWLRRHREIRYMPCPPSGGPLPAPSRTAPSHPDLGDSRPAPEAPGPPSGGAEQAGTPGGAAPTHPDRDDLDSIIDDPDASLGPQGLAPDRGESFPAPKAPGSPSGGAEQVGTPGGAAPSHPDLDDLDSIVDDPNAALGPQGLAPDDAPPRAAPPPVGPRVEPSTLFSLEGNLSAALRDCDRPAFEAAKQRMLALLDQLTAQESEPARKARWQAQRAQVEGRVFPDPCARDVAQGPARTPLIGVFFSIDRMDVPGTGIGFLRDGPPGEVPEIFAGETAKRVTVNRVGGAWQSPKGLRVEIDYGWGDARRTFDLAPPPGGGAGPVYGAESLSGSTGIAAPFPVRGETRVEVEDIGAYIEIPIGGGDVRLPRRRIQPFAFAEARRLRINYDGTLTGGGTFGGEDGFAFGYGQERDQRVRDTMIGVGAGGRADVPLGDGFSLFADARAGAYWQRSSLKSVERNSNNFTGPPDEDFTYRTDKDDDGIGFHGALSAGVDIALSAAVTLRLGGRADYRSRAGAPFNPHSGDQIRLDGLSTGLRHKGLWNWGGFAGIIVSLGR